MMSQPRACNCEPDTYEPHMSWCVIGTDYNDQRKCTNCGATAGLCNAHTHDTGCSCCEKCHRGEARHL